MTQGTLTIHTENILPIIKKWLYSDREIFVRELISNACDALSKMKMLGEGEGAMRIDLKVDHDKRLLQFIDQGIGMTGEEVEKYIAQVAFSGAEEFLNLYQKEGEAQQIIGHFGLGFFSAYMVAERVEIETLSYKEGAAPVFWSCDGSTRYTIDRGSRQERGTTVTLYLDAESDEFLEEGRLREILKRYCAFLPHPIYLNGALINGQPPLWLRPAQECSEKEYLDFYQQLYPHSPAPLFWIHLNVDYPFRLQGILYFPKVKERFDWSKNEMKLFCNRVFVSDQCRDLLPDYLMILKGALDSPDLPLNVSRSDLQRDRTVRQLGAHLSKKITDRLAQLYREERERFLAVWEELETMVKLGCLQDEKFYERSKEFLVWKNLGDVWTTLEECLERSASKQKIFYTADAKHAAHLLALYKAQGIEVLYMGHPVDTPLLSFLEGKLAPVRFQRIDGSLDGALLDPAREKTLLDAEGKTEGGRMAQFFRGCLEKEQVAVEAKSLASDELPAFLVVDEQQRRLRDYLQLAGQTPASLPAKQTLVVNTNNPLIASIYALGSSELGRDLALHVYELALLSQKEFDPNALHGFLSRSTSLLERLLAKR